MSRESIHKPPQSDALMSAAGLIFILVLVMGATTYFLSSASPHAPACDTLLASQIGAPAGQLCLRSLNIVVSNSNFVLLGGGRGGLVNHVPEFYVPVLVLKPGETGTMDILYHLSASTIGHVGPLPTVPPSLVPFALSVASATVNTSRVRFSEGVVVYQDNGWIIYRYTVNSSVDSTGYYAITPPYYFGIYPALDIGSDSKDLNMSTLSIWGYTGVMMSAEDTVPSTIVGTSGFNVLNATIPGLPDCPNPACSVISRSGGY